MLSTTGPSAMEVFRRNLQGLLRARQLSPSQFARASGVELYVVTRWLRQGVGRPRVDHLTRAAEALRIDDPYQLFDPDLLTMPTPTETRQRVDRETNPVLREVARERPGLFQTFTSADWEEIYSLHGTGGPLTGDGVVQAAERINAKRQLRRKFEILLETDHFETLAKIIELMYQDSAIL